MEERNDMLRVLVYADTTGLFTEEEMSQDNCCDLLFPRWMVEEWYNNFSEGFYDKEEYPFDRWYYEEYTADDTDGLYAFCVERGFSAQRDEVTEEYRKKCQTMYLAKWR